MSGINEFVGMSIQQVADLLSVPFADEDTVVDLMWDCDAVIGDVAHIADVAANALGACHDVWFALWISADQAASGHDEWYALITREPVFACLTAADMVGCWERVK